MTELRDRNVRDAVGYAAGHVPFYRDYFRAAGLDAREVRTADDLARLLPVLTRADLQADPERFRSDAPLGLNAIRFTTSGSTGLPVAIYHDRRSLLANVAWGERERTVETRFCGRRYRYDVAQVTFESSTNRQVLGFYGRTSFRPLRPRVNSLSVADPVEDTIAAINRVEPAVIRGYGAYLELLFRIVAARGLLFRAPRVVVYAGDTMSRSGRTFIEERFGVPVISRYNAVEAFKIGFTCETRDGFHLHEDLTHTWIVGPNGQPAPDGETGEVVVSYLMNRGSVLLNYRLGDLGRIAGRPCPCGRTSRMLVDLEGRVDELLALPEGRIVHPIQVERTVRARDGVLRFQLVQAAQASFVLRLAMRDEAAFAAAVDGLASDLHTLLGGASVEVEPDANLLATVGAKHRIVVPLPRSEGA